MCASWQNSTQQEMSPLTMWSWEWNPRPNIKFFYALLFFKSILLVRIYVHSMYVWVRDACVWGVHIEDRTTMGTFSLARSYPIMLDWLDSKSQQFPVSHSQLQDYKCTPQELTEVPRFSGLNSGLMLVTWGLWQCSIYPALTQECCTF